tara:strand:- start:1112 stop:1366 length:255 start_codon:yes stop_codon:yes gene_type:complete
MENIQTLKEVLITYVGEKTNPDNGDVTAEHIVEVMSEEFPEFLLLIAEENWIRGYEQALNDVEEGDRLVKEQTELNKVDATITQ